MGDVPSWIQVGIAVLGMIGASIFIVAQVKNTTNLLGSDVRHLASAVEKLTKKIDGQDEQLSKLRERLAVIENSVKKYDEQQDRIQQYLVNLGGLKGKEIG